MLVLLVILLGMTGVAGASRKRLAVLDFEGDNAEKIQSDVVKLIKRSHTVISQEKWDEAAESLSATKLTNKDIKKVARKLKLDGVITGVVEKRRSDYIIRIKLHAGTTGALVGDQVNTKTSGSRLDGTAQTDLKDELLAPIGELKQNRGGGDDDEADSEEADEKPVKKVKPSKADEDEDEDEDVKPVKKPAKVTKVTKPVKSDEDEDDDAKPTKPVKKSGFSTHKERESDTVASDDDDDDNEEENPLPASKKRPKKADKATEDEEDVATKSDEDDEDEESSTKVRKRRDEDDAEPMDSEKALTPQERAVDIVVGLSIMSRKLHFNYAADIGTVPAGYSGVPVPGFVIDGAFYPGAFSHKKGGIAENIGATVLFDKVLKVSTKDAAGTAYDTSASRFAIGVIARYPLTKGVVGASLRYGKQSFNIAAGAPVPGTSYSYINPELYVRYPVTPKILFNGSLGILGVTGTGDIQQNTQYGGATVVGIDVDLGADYMLKQNIFVRAALKVQTYGYKFKGTGMRSDPDGDMMADVTGARDSYYGFAANIGYLY